MSDYSDLIRLVAEQNVREGRILGNTGVSKPSLLRDMEDLWRRMKTTDVPPPPRIDLQGHPTIDLAYEINWPSHDHAWIGAKTRQMIVVPERDLKQWAEDLRAAGFDVRIFQTTPNIPNGDA